MKVRPFYKFFAAGVCAFYTFAGHAQRPILEATVLNTYDAINAFQGVAVARDHFYAINNAAISKHNRQTGAEELIWTNASDSSESLIHLDGGVVLADKLFAAHSNYPAWPMTSSIEIRDAATLTKLDSHQFGVQLGSLTWVDFHAGYWWATFANYDIVQPGADHPYGETRNTVLVKMNEEFEILQRLSFPDELLAKMSPMSNSGGSWGPDGYLYITGHDHPEIYVVNVSENDELIEWLATIHVPELNGQGIAWDRTTRERELWSISRSVRKVYRLKIPEIP